MFGLGKKLAERNLHKLNAQLYMACLSGNLNSILSLLSKGADPRHQFSKEEVIQFRTTHRRDNEHYQDDLALDFAQIFENALPNLRLEHHVQTKKSRSCIELAIEASDLELLKALCATGKTPVGAMMYDLMTLAVELRAHDITSSLLEMGGFRVFDGALLRKGIEKESAPLIEHLLSYKEDCSPILDLVLECSIQSRSVSLLQLFRKNGFVVTPSQKMWREVVLTGSADYLREIVLHTKPSPELASTLIESAIESKELESLSVLIGAGLGELQDFKLVGRFSRGTGAFQTFLTLATQITEGQQLPQDQWINHIENVLGNTRQVMKAKKIEPKDLFKFNKNQSFRELPFVRVALRAAYLATIISEEQAGVAQVVMQRLLQQDLSRISETKGLSWTRYAGSIDQEAALPDHLPDLFRDITDALLLPVWSIDNLTNGLPNEDLARKRRELEQFSGALYFEGKDTLTTTLLSRRWLRQVDKIVAEYRPAKAGLEWIPLFEPIELDSGLKIVCLNTTAQLVEEGRVMKHCVGSGGYATGCAEGRQHIISIRNKQNESIATIELFAGGSRDVLSLGRHGPVSVMQFNGHKNSEPPRAAKQAWEEFKKRLSEGKVDLAKSIGATEETKDLIKNARFLKLFGFYPKDAPTTLPAMYQRYASISHESKSGYDMQFFDPSVRRVLLGRFAENPIDAS